MQKILTGNLTFKSLCPPDLSKCTKEELEAYFQNSYDLNESLFTSLRDESMFYKCPDRLRLPLIFYYGHTAAVYVNKLILAGLLKERVNLEFETMFETGVDEMSWDDTENYRMGGSYKWPPIEEVVEYRRQVRNIILGIIHKTPLELPITMDSVWWALVMGMEHERIHLETSSVLIRQLPISMVTRPKGWKYAPLSTGNTQVQNTLIRVEGGEVTFGKPRDFPSFGWDNEYGQVKSWVPMFKASKFLITQREYLEFVKAGGYDREELWTEEGWRWKTFRQSKHPVFWVCDEGCKSGCGSDLATYSHCQLTEQTTGHLNGTTFRVANGQDSISDGYLNVPLGGSTTEVNGIHNGADDGLTNGHLNGVINEMTNGHFNGLNNVANGDSNNQWCIEKRYRYRAMFDVIDMPWTWPVEVNFHEAKAYCTWMGPEFRLLIEAEHNVIRGNQESPSVGVTCDIIFSENKEINHNLHHGSSTPVDMYPPTELGFHDVFGNVWQWTEDHFNGLDGFSSHWLYDDFSTPCFDGRHNIILGGSWISTGDEASRFARYSFRRHFIQHAGFRIAKSVEHGMEPVNLPVRLVDMDLYILGCGKQDNPVILDKSAVKPQMVKSTNTQYQFDTVLALKGILELEFGYRKSFPTAVADLCKKYGTTQKLVDSLVWLGAGVGRGPLLASTSFKQVLALDYGGHFINTAMRLQNGEKILFTRPDWETGSAFLDTVVLNPQRVTFKQLTWVSNEVGSHDITVVTFLERTSNPQAWLVRLWEITRKTGLVIIVSRDRTWSKDRLQPILENRLICSGIEDMPYSGPKGEQKALVTIWKHC
ncbi:hypothetical protein ACJMK2_042668 [Sinanodonta woodiana]|uniref:5-histidylcysteine sulfoxide synthase n=1 Tax=Sinanodonta woodiana TaxID=1069815 RepID=A0ABD3W830_SINWO